MLEGKILITGNTGFKGSWLSQILLNSHAEIIGIGLKPNTKPNLFDTLQLADKTKTYFQDIRDGNKIKEIINYEKPEIVFHLAAQPLVRESYNNPGYTFETNLLGTVNVLQAIKEVETVKSAVIITTDKVYKDKKWIWPYREGDELGGFDPYSSSKACMELITNAYIQSFFNPKDYDVKHQTLVATARAGNVIGGGDWSKDRLIPDIIKSIYETNNEIALRNPNAIRPWQHVLEPLMGYLMLSKKLCMGNKEFVGAWNFGPKEENSIKVEDVVKKGISLSEKGRYSIEEQSEKHETEILRLDSTKAKTRLGWKQTLDINKTLDWTFKWYKNYYENKNSLDFTEQQIKQFLELTKNEEKFR